MLYFFKNHLAVGLENVNFNIVQRQLEIRVDDSTDEDPLRSRELAINVQAIIYVEGGKGPGVDGCARDSCNIALHLV